VNTSRVLPTSVYVAAGLTVATAAVAPLVVLALLGVTSGETGSGVPVREVAVLGVAVALVVLPALAVVLARRPRGAVRVWWVPVPVLVVAVLGVLWGMVMTVTGLERRAAECREFFCDVGADVGPWVAGYFVVVAALTVWLLVGLFRHGRRHGEVGASA
jgi:hypothetical protein